MDPLAAILAFTIAVSLLVLTPGVDTALVLRTALVEGPNAALAAGLGVATGVLIWGIVTALGLGVLLASSKTAYQVLTLAGAAYLVWLGLRMLYRAWRPPPRVQDAQDAVSVSLHSDATRAWFWRGLMTNLLNPKVGVFYVSFLPQFIPSTMPMLGFGIGLAAIHAAITLIWFCILCAATRQIASLLRGTAFTRAMDGAAGTAMMMFAVRLAFDPRP